MLKHFPVLISWMTCRRASVVASFTYCRVIALGVACAVMRLKYSSADVDCRDRVYGQGVTSHIVSRVVFASSVDDGEVIWL